MRSKPDEAVYAAPLLFRHATPRTSSAELPGYYDPSTQLWVIETTAGIVPVVEAAASTLIETNTSTRVRQEVDDQDASTDLRSFDALLDTSTLTKVRQESADDDLTRDATMAPLRPLGTLAELATKTAVQQESDDQMSTGSMLELETRSLNDQEGIDDDFPGMLLELQTKTFADVEGDDDDLSMIH